MNALFDPEKLTVCQDAIRFVVWAGELLETRPKSLAAYDPLDQGKEIRMGIVSMLAGLIRSTSADRIHEERAEYETDNRRLTDYDYD